MFKSVCSLQMDKVDPQGFSQQLREQGAVVAVQLGNVPWCGLTAG